MAKKEKEKKTVGDSNKRNFAIVAAISVMVMVIATTMIYLYTRQLKPDVVEANAQSISASENVGYINPDSPQQLETEAAKVEIKPIANSQIVIVAAGIFMIVIIVSYGVVKYLELKEE